MNKLLLMLYVGSVLSNEKAIENVPLQYKDEVKRVVENVKDSIKRS